MRYGYEAGSPTETKNNLDATRINVKLDWNPSEKNKLSLSYRYNNAERITAPGAKQQHFHPLFQQSIQTDRRNSYCFVGVENILQSQNK
jgi:hypothetical protein